jgi:hypothetical protein
VSSEDSPPRPRAKKRRPPAVVEAIVGLGLDGKDGHTRVTRADRVLLLGGSAETHEKMQEMTIRLTERLSAKGKSLGDVSPRELRDLVRDL